MSTIFLVIINFNTFFDETFCCDKYKQFSSASADATVPIGLLVCRVLLEQRSSMEQAIMLAAEAEAIGFLTAMVKGS